MTALAVPDESFAVLLDLQEGVLTSAQALRHVSRGHLRAQIASRRWQRRHRGIVVTHNGPLTERQQAWASLLAAPPGSVLGGATAAAWDGLRGFEPQAVHVILPQGQRRPLIPGTICTWSSHLAEPDVHPHRLPPRTRLARSILDMATTAPNERISRGAILAAVQQRLVRPVDLTDALQRRGPCLRRRLIVESITDAEGGIHSVPELDFDGIRRAYGLPTPTRQRRVRGTSGRYYLDVSWDDRALSAEVHGIHHREVSNWERDLDRHNDLTAHGRAVLHFTSYAVRHRQSYVGDILCKAMAGRRPSTSDLETR